MREKEGREGMKWLRVPEYMKMADFSRSEQEHKMHRDKEMQRQDKTFYTERERAEENK